MIFPNPAQFALSTVALQAHHSAVTKAINKSWDQAIRGAARTYLSRPIPDVRPAQIYAAFEMAAEILFDPDRRAELDVRAEAIESLASERPLDATPCDIVVSLPEKASPALAQKLEELGLIRHTDARRTRGISCNLWHGHAAPSVVARLVADEGGQVLPMSTPKAPETTRDTPPTDEAPVETTDVEANAETRETEIDTPEPPRPGRRRRSKSDMASANVEPNDTAVPTQEIEKESAAPPTAVDQPTEVTSAEDAPPPAPEVDAGVETNAQRVPRTKDENWSPSPGCSLPDDDALIDEYLRNVG